MPVLSGWKALDRGPGDFMGFERQTTMTASQLQKGIAAAKRYPHGHVHKGDLIVSPQAFETPGRETNLIISRFAILDCTGSIHIGPWCNISARTRIYTHDHIHMGKKPLFETETEYGVLWQDKTIGTDVWLHDASMVLYQVTHIPDGVVLGAGSVLTKNPGPYEIWAGVPARKIGHRTDTAPEAIEVLIRQNGNCSAQKL
jgi:acetyltransferase-like isoleucine patch superfamily enzyme